MSARTYSRLLLLAVLLALSLVACREVRDGGPTSVPTLTHTPISTALPLVPTAIPAGTQDNPLQMVILPFGPMEEARELETDFEESILEMSGVAVDVVLVDRHAEALAALCNSGGESVSAAWLDGITYTAAMAQNCGTPVRQVRRDRSEDLATGAPGQIIITRVLGVAQLSALRDRTFCRLGYDDLYSCLIPTLMMQAYGIDPLDYLGEVIDYEDVESMLADIVSGDCTATGIAEPELNALIEDDPDIQDGIRVVETSVAFPYNIFLVPFEVPLGARLQLVPALVDMTQDPDMAAQMRVFLGQDALRNAAPDDFADLDEFMASTGLDFAQLGN